MRGIYRAATLAAWLPRHPLAAAAGGMSGAKNVHQLPPEAARVVPPSPSSSAAGGKFIVHNAHAGENHPVEIQGLSSSLRQNTGHCGKSIKTS